MPPLRTHSSRPLSPRCIYKKHKPKERMTARLVGRAMQLERCEWSLGNFTDGKTEARNGTVTDLSSFTEEFAYRWLTAELTRFWEWHQKGRGRWKKNQYLMVPTSLIHLKSGGPAGSLSTTIWPGHRLYTLPPLRAQRIQQALVTLSVCWEHHILPLRNGCWHLFTLLEKMPSQEINHHFYLQCISQNSQKCHAFLHRPQIKA